MLKNFLDLSINFLGKKTSSKDTTSVELPKEVAIAEYNEVQNMVVDLYPVGKYLWKECRHESKEYFIMVAEEVKEEEKEEERAENHDG